MSKKSALLSLISTASVVCAAALPATADAAFTTGSLPPQPGLELTRNTDAEPGMAESPDGTIWATAFAGIDDPRRGLTGRQSESSPDYLMFANADVWASHDGGHTYRWMAAPFSMLKKRGLGGDDIDIAVATERNSQGHYNLYVASLWLASFSGADFVGEMSVAVSHDDGRHWLVDPVAATIPLDDRPWLTTDGACTAYLSYHALPTAALTVQKYDFCNPADTVEGATVDEARSTRYVNFAPQLLTGKAGVYVLASFGKPAVDTVVGSPYLHRIYIPALDCPPQALREDVGRATASSQRCAGSSSELYMLTSGDGGAHWQLRPVTASPDPRITIWSPSVAIDHAGTVYITWFDKRGMYLVKSSDGGRTWTPRDRIDTGPVRSVAYPTIAAGALGDIRIAFDGTTRVGEPDDPAAMGAPGSAGAAVWDIDAISSSDGGQAFSAPAQITPIHTGTVCVNGEGEGDCDVFSPTRSIWETLGIEIAPSGETAITYTSDLPGGGPVHDHVDYALGR